MTDAEVDAARGRPIGLSLMGIDPGGRRPWTIMTGQDLEPQARGDAGDIADQQGAGCPPRGVSGRRDRAARGVRPGSRRPAARAIPYPAASPTFRSTTPSELSAAASRASVATACGEEGDEADMLLIASREGHGPDAAVAAIERRRPDLHPVTNEQIVARMQDSGFTYFRQISTVLSTITMLFGFLLMTVLLTVSVHQRLAEIAALRALGLSRARMAADVLSQSVLLVGLWRRAGRAAGPRPVGVARRDSQGHARHSGGPPLLRLRAARPGAPRRLARA